MGTPKRYGIITDIHANLKALQVALAYLKNAKVEEILCLGDLVGYGDQPLEVIDLLRELPNLHCVIGNHDRYVLGDKESPRKKTALEKLEWTAKHISKEQDRFLRQMPHVMTIEEHIVIVHDALTERNAYILTPQEISKNLNYMINNCPGRRICFYGHTHIPMLIGTKAVITDLKETKSFQLDKNDVYLINPGPISQPRDKCPHAAFGIFDVEKWTMTFVRKPCDNPPAEPITSTKRW